MEKIIKWEKWYDPFGKDVDEAEFPGHDGINSEDDDEDEENMFYDEQTDQLMPLKDATTARNKNQPFLFTHMGIIPLTEYTNPSKLFDFWTGHTNFKITRKDINVITDVNGVESFDLFSPYRFRISVGKAFKSIDVKDEINVNIKKPPKIRVAAIEFNIGELLNGIKNPKSA